MVGAGCFQMRLPQCVGWRTIKIADMNAAQKAVVGVNELVATPVALLAPFNPTAIELFDEALGAKLVGGRLHAG